MTVLRTVRVAAIQATPVILDAEASVAKAARLLGEAADAGAELAVLPECFVSRVPVERLGEGGGRRSAASDELWERMWLSSVDVPGPLRRRARRGLPRARHPRRRSASTSASPSAPGRSTTRWSRSGPRGCCTSTAS